MEIKNPAARARRNGGAGTEKRPIDVRAWRITWIRPTVFGTVLILAAELGAFPPFALILPQLRVQAIVYEKNY